MTQLRGDGYPSSYLYTLDIARGIAALAVVLWHWQHFFFRGPLPGSFERGDQPFYAVFSLFYEKGWMAVDFFFVLSGFIFLGYMPAQFAIRVLVCRSSLSYAFLGYTLSTFLLYCW